MKTYLKFFVLLALVISTSCKAPQTVSHHGGSLHFSDVTEVRAYRLNWDEKDSFDGIINRKGRLNSTRIPIDGVILDKSQLQRLEAAVTGSHPSHPVARCLYPHHAFVFFDSRGGIIGHIDICFLCANYRGEPTGFAESWDLDALQALIKDLGMPIQNEKWD